MSEELKTPYEHAIDKCLELRNELSAERAKVAQLEEENKRLLAANRDAMDWFNVCKADKDALEAQNAVLREALEKIATTTFTQYDGIRPYISDHDSGYALGVADGHRLAAKWAQEALAIAPSECLDAMRKKEKELSDALCQCVDALLYWKAGYINGDADLKLGDAPLNDCDDRGDEAIEAARAAGVGVE